MIYGTPTINKIQLQIFCAFPDCILVCNTLVVRHKCSNNDAKTRVNTIINKSLIYQSLDKCDTSGHNAYITVNTTKLTSIFQLFLFLAFSSSKSTSLLKA